MEETTHVPEAPKEKVSTPNHLQLMEFKPQYFGGIRPDMNFVFYLGDGPVVGFQGDQGLGKTSLLNCLILLLGGEEAVNAMNVSTDEKGKRQKNKTASLTFKDKRNENVTYEVRVTKTAYSVKKIELTEGASKPVTYNIESPKAFMRDLFGPIGISPMILKDKDGKAQIEWMRSLYRFTKDQLELEKRITDNIKAKFKDRTAVNNDIKRLKNEVYNTGYYSWDDENKVYVPLPKRLEDLKNVADNLKDEDTIKKAMEDAQDKIRKRDIGLQTMDQLKESEKSCIEEIADLERKLQAKRTELVNLNKRILDGEEYNKQFENAQAEFDAAQKSMMNLGDLKIMKSKLEEADTKNTEYNSKVEAKITVTKAIDELRLAKKQFIEMFTPKIEGLKVIIDEGIDKNNVEEGEDDNPDKDLDEGLYYNGRTMQELSESELWKFFMLICKELGVRFLFIENAQSLGTDAADTINWFVQEGYGNVFYTAMMRGQKELQFSINGEFN
jgi:GTPase SAR1 family protein